MNSRRSRAASNTAAVVGRVDCADRLALDLRPIPLFKQGGRISVNQFPALGLIQRGIENAMHVMHGARRQAALAIAAAAFQGLA